MQDEHARMRMEKGGCSLPGSRLSAPLPLYFFLKPLLIQSALFTPSGGFTTSAG
jgi:hypothetical protein